MEFVLPIEKPLVADQEGQCSTQVEPSSTQDQQAPPARETTAPTRDNLLKLIKHQKKLEAPG